MGRASRPPAASAAIPSVPLAPTDAHRWRRRFPALFAAALLLAVGGAAVAAPAAPPSSDPRGFFRFGGLMLFLADEVHDVDARRTLVWRSDGTASGTYALPTCDWPCTDFPWIVAATPRAALFVVQEEGGGLRLWRTGGTQAGTLRGAGLPAGAHLAHQPWGYRWAPRLGGVVIQVSTSGGAEELWLTDAALATARRLVRMAAPGPLLGLVGDRVLYAVEGGPAVRGLWAVGSEGPAARLAALGGNVPSYLAFQAFRHESGERAVLAVQPDGSPDARLWTTDGTAAGTRPVEALPDAVELGFTSPLSDALVAVEGAVLVVARQAGGGHDLWRTDGTAAGTWPLTAFTGAARVPLYSGLQVHVEGGRLYFTADDGQRGEEVWVSDGGAGTAVPLADLCPGRCSSGARVTAAPAADRVFGVAWDGLFVSDGTSAGTGPRLPGALLLDTAELPADLRAGGHLYSLALADGVAVQLWATRLADGATRRLTDLSPQGLTFGASGAALGDLLLFSADDGVHGRELWRSDGTVAGTRLVADLAGGGPLPPGRPTGLAVDARDPRAVMVSWDPVPAAFEYRLSYTTPVGGARELPPTGATEMLLTLEPDTPYTVRVVAANDRGVSAPGEPVAFTTAGWNPPTACVADDERLCLGGGRFEVRVGWLNQHSPPGRLDAGAGHALAADGSDRTGYFWFFRPDNVELIVKVLDGRPVNGFHWTFYGGLSDVEHWITVTDVETGERRTYYNPPGEICGAGDNRSFPVEGAAAGPLTAALEGVASWAAPAATAAPVATCSEGPDALCLLDGRFRVSVEWHDHHNGGSGTGGAVPFADRTGFFWFFRPDNVELVVKVLDGSTINGKVWVFYGALTDVGYTITVTDTTSQAVRRWTNPPGNLCGGAETEAF